MNTQNNARGLDNAAERDYWQTQYEKEGYYEAGQSYDDYDGAYRAGYEGRGKYAGRKFDEVENELKADWEQAKGTTRLGWEKVKHAARSAWDRVERAMPGDADRDGR